MRDWSHADRHAKGAFLYYNLDILKPFFHAKAS